MNQLDDTSLTRFSENGGYYCCFSVGDLLSNHGPVDVESDTVRDPVSKDQHDCEEYLDATSCIVSASAPPPQDGHVLPEIPEAAEAEALKGKRNLYSSKNELGFLRDSLRNEIYEALQRTQHEVAEQLKVDQEEEVRMESIVRESARKMLLSKKRVAAIQESKSKSFALKEKGNEAHRHQALQMEAEERARIHEEKKRAASSRRQKIEAAKKERSKRLEDAVLTKLQTAETKLRLRHDELANTNSMKAEQKSLKLLKVGHRALEIEKEGMIKKQKAIEEKEKRFRDTKDQLEEKHHLLVTRQSDELIQSLLMAEQRRLLIEEQKAGEQELARIKQSKEAVLANSRASAKAERPIKLNKVYAEQLRLGSSQTKNTTSLFESPGPGSYFRENSNAAISCRGGYMASSRPNDRANENPGPGTYSLQQKEGREGSGSVPFGGRGKSDVDWTILMASKLPGVGQYDLHKSSQPRGAAKILGKGKTELDKVILKAKRMPGPGDYELIADGKPRPNTIDAYILGIDKGYRYKER